MKYLWLTKFFSSYFKKGNKLTFLFYGSINFLLTNFILQINILFLPTILAAFISQLFNLNFGFYSYGLKVFKVNYLSKNRYLRYIFLHLFLWNINWILIDLINSYNVSKNLAALIVLPFLAVISYVYQKRIVFID